MRISFDFKWERPKWWYKLFTCRHEVASVTENPYSRYGSSTSYKMCLKCGRKAMEIGINCIHEVNVFGMCGLCQDRITKHDCEHEFTQEPDTNDFYCKNCGEWNDEM